jgi:pimeloyl-ACP methyl ester carboxylesterase
MITDHDVDDTIYDPIVETPLAYRREPADAHPPMDYEPYKSTALRHPREPLVYLPHTITEVTGPALTERRLITSADAAGLPGVRVPTLVIGGAQDPAIPAEHSGAIATAIPGARLEILDPAAHLASVERAEDVTRLIDHHLDHHLRTGALR